MPHKIDEEPTKMGLSVGFHEKNPFIAGLGLQTQIKGCVRKISTQEEATKFIVKFLKTRSLKFIVKFWLRHAFLREHEKHMCTSICYQS